MGLIQSHCLKVVYEFLTDGRWCRLWRRTTANEGFYAIRTEDQFGNVRTLSIVTVGMPEKPQPDDQGFLEGQPEVELIEAFAGAIPIEVIGNLLGIPHYHNIV